MDASALRVQPLGSDDLGNEYWYFYGTRLYKQEPPAEKKGKNWEQEWKNQKEQSFKKRGRGRPKKNFQKPRKSDGESDDFEDVDSNKNKRFMNIDERSRWSVVCNTIEDWVNFAEKFKDSNSNCERQLFETIKDNFLPALNEIYQEKERRLKQKLKELIQLESRNQMTHMVTRRETRRQKKISDEPFLTNEHDDAHKEHLNKSRAKRLEERNRRINEGTNFRSTRNKKPKYSSDEEIEEIDESEEVEESSERSESVEESSKSSDEFVLKHQPLYSDYGEDVKSEVLKLLSEVKSHKDAWPFLQPVDKKDAPGYYEIISQPMDLSTITQKLIDGKYQTVSKLVFDFNKLVSNCRLYNGENSAHMKMANTIHKIFQTGLLKIVNPERENIENHTETSSFTVTSKYSHTRIISKRRSNSLDSKKKKRKIRNMDALEVLSRESELALEKSDSNSFFEDLQMRDRQTGLTFGGLKVFPINSHPSVLIEKFLSNPPIEESENVEKCNSNSNLVNNQNENSFKTSTENHDTPPSLDSADVCYVPEDGKESPDLSVLDVNCQQTSYENTTEVEINSTHQKNVENYPVRSASNSPKDSQQNYNHSNKSEVLMPSGSNILDECNNQNVSSLMSGFNREPLYSANEANTSLSPRSVTSPQSHGSNASSPEQARDSPQNSTSSFIKNPVVEKHVPFLQDGLSIQSSLTNFSSDNGPSTVDASILGFSSFSNKSPVSTDSANQLGNKSFISTSPQILNSGTTLTTHISSSVTTQEMPSTAQFSAPLQVNVPYEKAFPYQNPIQIYKPEPNKFPALKVSLPPSTGELVVVPDKLDGNKMTLHLLAQPHLSGSQPIQSCLTIRSNNNSGSPTFQSEKPAEFRGGKENPVATSRQQPLSSNSPQFQISPNGLLIMPSQTLEKNVSAATGLLSIPSTFTGFTSNSSNPMFSSTYANSFIPVSTALTTPVPTTRSDYNNQTSMYNTSIKPSTNIYMNSETNNRFQVHRTTSSCLKPSALPYYQMANNDREIFLKTNSGSIKHTANSAQKVYPSNEPYTLNSNNFISNSTGLYEAMYVPKENTKKSEGSQDSKTINSDKQYQLNTKSMSDAMGSTSYYSSTINNTLQNYAFNSTSLNPPLVYTQVNPNQPSQFINVPNYMIANQNMLQYPLNPSVLNMQPFHIPNRPVLSMDLGHR